MSRFNCKVVKAIPISIVKTYLLCGNLDKIMLNYQLEGKTESEWVEISMEMVFKYMAKYDLKLESETNHKRTYLIIHRN